MKQMRPVKIDISHKSIFFISVFILGLWMIFLIKDLLIMLFISVIFMSALNPIVSFFSKYKVPKALSIGISYLIIIAIMSVGIVFIAQPLVEQSGRLIITFPALASEVLGILNIDQSLVSSELAKLAQNFFSITLTIFSNILAVVFLLVITFYLLLERDNLEQRISDLFIGREEKTQKLIIKIEERLGAWLRGQVVLSLIIGICSYIFLTILGIPYALPLAIFAGVMEIIPMIGPIISAIPAVLIAYTITPYLGAVAIVFYFLLQQFENNLIVPQVMKRAVGLNPLFVILAIAIGDKLLGFSGALLAVPVAVVIQIIVTEIIEERKE
jgi:predicted PurR-regulated permease PerM